MTTRVRASRARLIFNVGARHAKIKRYELAQKVNSTVIYLPAAALTTVKILSALGSPLLLKKRMQAQGPIPIKINYMLTVVFLVND
jgi:hypothetical protein